MYKREYDKGRSQSFLIFLSSMMLHKVIFLLVVGVTTLAAGDISLHHSPVHHGASAHHGSPHHHGSPVHHSNPIHHASPIHHSSPKHHSSPIHHASPIHHSSPKHHSSPAHHASTPHHAPSAHHTKPAHHSHPSHHNNAGYAKEVYADTPAQYNYNYLVHDEYSGDHFGHDESRDGYNTEGKYFVHLPDGRIQTVTYYADETGYHSTVSYEGEATYDAHHAHGSGYPAPKNSYHQPEPAYH